MALLVDLRVVVDVGRPVEGPEGEERPQDAPDVLVHIGRAGETGRQRRLHLERRVRPAGPRLEVEAVGE